MIMLTGSFGRFALLGGDRQVFDMYMEPMRAFFQDVAIKKTDFVGNELGLYSFLPVGRNNKAIMSSLSVPKHLLQSRKNCKTWQPKGRMSLQPQEIQTFEVEYMGEQCSDQLIGNCLNRVLGTGNDVYDIFATPEGRSMFDLALNNIFLGLGNSLYDLVTFGGDSTITDSNTNFWWNTSTSEETTEDWANFLDQMTGTGITGFIPLIEEAKADGLAHFNIEIPEADVNGDEYIGTDVTALFDECIGAAKPVFRVALKQRSSFGAAILVSKSIFDAYKNWLIATYTHIPEAYSLLLNGELQRGVLMYDGLPVICMDEWTEFDETVGVNTHRVVVTALRNLVIAHDIIQLDQFGGIGMRIEQSPVLKDKGITYMHTAFRVGAAIADTDFMVNASLIVTPAE